MFYDAAGRLRSLLASWTDVAEPDVFIQVAAGRSFVRPYDLATLAALRAQRVCCRGTERVQYELTLHRKAA